MMDNPAPRHQGGVPILVVEGEPSVRAAVSRVLLAHGFDPIDLPLEEAILVVDRDARVRYWSEGAARLTGIPAARALGRGADLFPGFDLSELLGLLKHVADAQHTVRHVYTTRTLGAPKRMALAAYPSSIGSGVMGVELDASDEPGSFSFLHALLEDHAEMFVSADAEGHVRFANQTFARYVGLAPAKLVGASVFELLPPADALRLRAAAVALGGPIASVVTASTDECEGRGPIEWAVRATLDGEGRPRDLRLIGRPLSRDGIASDERELLLRELDHRVRNNLQIVASLIRLRLDAVEGHESRGPLLDCLRRVSALALAYERHHHALGREQLDAAAYLAQIVEDQLGMSVRHPRLVLELDPCGIAFERATQLGLIASELVANALRHAWPEGEPGTLRVALRAVDALVELEVEDDGVGLPAGAEEGSHKLGLRLARHLSAQVGGALELTSGRGTRVSLRFRGQP